MDILKYSLLEQLALLICGDRPTTPRAQDRNTKKKLIPLSDYARGIGLTEPQAAVLAKDLNLDVERRGGGDELWVDVGPLADVLWLVAKIGKLGPDQRIAKAQFAREARDSLVRLLVEAGLRYDGSDFERGALLRFTRKDGSAVGILSYVSTTLNRAGQTTFSIAHLDDKDVDWVVLIATRLERIYARTRQELAAAASGEKTMGLTVRPNTKTDDLLQNRLEEIISGRVRERPPPTTCDVWRRKGDHAQGRRKEVKRPS